jgi:hypothetical protein
LKKAAESAPATRSSWFWATSAIASCPATIGVSVGAKPASCRYPFSAATKTGAKSVEGT